MENKNETPQKSGIDPRISAAIVAGVSSIIITLLTIYLGDSKLKKLNATADEIEMRVKLLDTSINQILLNKLTPIWQDLNISTRWQSAAPGNEPQYSIGLNGCVKLRGLIKTTLTIKDSDIAQLPKNYRPLKKKFFMIPGHNGDTDLFTLSIDQNGFLSVSNKKGVINDWLSLDGISYCIN